MSGPKFRLKANRVLLFLALHGPCIKAEMEKELAIDHPTMHKIVKELATRHVIHPYSTNNPIVKRYDLTEAGLLELITLLRKDELKTIDRLAAKYTALLPRIFDAWPVFNKLGAGDAARIRLVDVAKKNLRMLAPDFLAGLKMYPTDSQGHISELDGAKDPEAVFPYLMDYVMDSFWDPESQFGLATPESWERTLAKDAVLRKKALDVILERETARIHSRSQQIKNLGGKELKFSKDMTFGEISDVFLDMSRMAQELIDHKVETERKKL